MKTTITYQLRKLANLYREAGFKRTAMRVTRALLRRLYRREEHLILVRSLSDPLRLDVAADLSIRSLSDFDETAFLAFLRQHSTPRQMRHFVSWIDKRYDAFLAVREGKVIGYMWWITNKTADRYPGLALKLHEIELMDGDAYGFALYVAPDQRGGGTSTLFHAQILSELRRLGYERFWGFVDGDNMSARWLFASTGYKVTRRTIVYTVGSVLRISGRRLSIKNE